MTHLTYSLLARCVEAADRRAIAQAMTTDLQAEIDATRMTAHVARVLRERAEGMITGSEPRGAVYYSVRATARIRAERAKMDEGWLRAFEKVPDGHLDRIMKERRA